jgi:hypothetical protein
MSKPTDSRFVLCIHPGDSGDLEFRKIYQALPDPKAAREGYLRILDESGEDCLYPAECFAPLLMDAARPPSP